MCSAKMCTHTCSHSETHPTCLSPHLEGQCLVAALVYIHQVVHMDGIALLRQSQDVRKARGNSSGVCQPLNGRTLGEGRRGGEGRGGEGRGGEGREEEGRGGEGRGGEGREGKERRRNRRRGGGQSVVL